MARRGGTATVEMPPAEELDEGSNDKSASLIRILQLARREWCWLFVGCILLVGSLAPTLLMPIIFGQVIDAINSGDSQSERETQVDWLLQCLLAILLAGTVATIARAFIFNGAGERVVARLRIMLFRAILQQEIAMFDRRKTGELLSRLTADTTQLQDVATSNISMFVRSMGQISFSAVLMFKVSWRLALLVFGVVPVSIICIVCYGRVVKRLATAYTDALSVASDVATQSITNVRTMRSFAAEELEMRKYEKAVGDPDVVGDRCWYPRGTSSYQAGIRKTIAGAVFIGVVTLVGSGAIVLVIWYGARQVIEGSLSQGNLIAFILYSVQIAASLGMMSGIMSSIFNGLGASKRTFQLIDRQPRVPLAGGITPEALRGVICFKQVSFAYPTRPDVPVLSDFTLDIPQNATMAFVGSSGAGKSTLLLLIQRFYDVTSGEIFLDDLPLYSYDSSWMRKQFAFVQQEPALFSGTIRQNIAYGFAVRQGSPDAAPSQDVVEQVARAAFAHDFIEAFPEGYDTVVGERGVRLSGGQKQRVAIARALLMDPRVLLLDEATSALDAESEAVVARAIEKAMVGRTTLIVAHRLSTVQNADQIVVIGDSKIVDQGTHSELMESSAKYQELVRRQLQTGESASDGNHIDPVTL
eukprot:TRINITY_DN5946_c0_g2_i1.p1 TRINITY_DN5946_c0_g2~~TRINITY_DN5946_c0_g2_i1.p1  ORF type:complete len:668 (-),score=107.78 TRINITY_DN5946_c0_g2_i1:373-2298(-)